MTKRTKTMKAKKFFETWWADNHMLHRIQGLLPENDRERMYTMMDEYARHVNPALVERELLDDYSLLINHRKFDPAYFEREYTRIMEQLIQLKTHNPLVLAEIKRYHAYTKKQKKSRETINQTIHEILKLAKKEIKQGKQLTSNLFDGSYAHKAIP